jgi:hypothetical protein
MPDLVVASKNLALDAALDVGASQKMKFYTGSSPGIASAATGTLLCTCSMASNSWAAASGGSKAAGAITGAANVASGTVGYVRITKSDGTTGIVDLTVGTSGTEVIVPTVTFTQSVTTTVSSCTVSIT